MEIFGLLNIDKPQGYTSHDIVDVIRKRTGVQKVGHAGTLDPMATGVLVICLGAATRLSEYIMGHTKIYQATLRLGQITNTYDAEGKLMAENNTPVSREELEAVLPQFKGKIQQVPPMYSAIKQDGEKLYEKARRGEVIDRTPRDVSIYKLTLDMFNYPHATLTIRCSAGTYIRSLAYDIGQVLGVGAYLSALRRLASGENFMVENTVSLEKLLTDVQAGTWQEHIMAVGLGLSQFPRIELNNFEEAAIRQGKFIALDIGNDGPLQAWADDGYFIGILTRREDGKWKPDKVFPAPNEE